MRLHAAATFFDRLVCFDAYNPAVSFKAQLDLYDDSKRDGTTVDRRVLSVAPSVVLPTRQTVKVHDDYFLLGVRHVDSYNNAPIRHKYVAHRADGLARVKTMAQAITGAAGTGMYAGKVWVKDLKEPEESSALYGFFNLYFSPAETITPGMIVEFQGRLHLVRNSYVSAAGLRVGASDELPVGCLVSVSYVSESTTYNPNADSFAEAAPVVVSGLWHRHEVNFRLELAKADPFLDGDIVMNLAKAQLADSKAGDSFTVAGRRYEVLSVRDDGAGAWMLHARP